MSQKRFPIRKQEGFKKMPHSEKYNVSAKESQASKKKVAELSIKLRQLASNRDWALNQADKFWEKAKEYEVQGRIQQALEAKTRYEKEAHRAKCYDTEIDYIQKLMDKLALVYSGGMKIRKNYANIRVKEPPSDDQQ